LVLSDKLVPAEVLALIPSNITVKIAKKFPGNADGAQSEMMLEAVEAAGRGETVVRVGRLRSITGKNDANINVS
jgi:uroporphyrin-III C-methyltransferase